MTAEDGKPVELGRAAIGPSLDPTYQFLLARVRYRNAVEMPLHAPHPFGAARSTLVGKSPCQL